MKNNRRGAQAPCALPKIATVYYTVKSKVKYEKKFAKHLPGAANWTALIYVISNDIIDLIDYFVFFYWFYICSYLNNIQNMPVKF